MQKYLIKSRSAGFTLVEIMVVTVVLGILTVVVLGAMGDFYNDTNTTLQQTTKFTNSQSALAKIKNDMASSTNLLAQSTDDASFPSLSAADRCWVYDGSNSCGNTDPGTRVLITESYATTKDASGNTVPSLMNCSSTMAQTKVMRVYYVKNSTLYRRTILPYSSTSNYCDNKLPLQTQTSCTTNCNNPDAVLEHNVTAFDIDYYKTTTSSTPDLLSSDLNATVSGQPAIVSSMTQRVGVTVTTKQHIGGNDTLQKVNSLITLSDSAGSGGLVAGSGNNSTSPPDINGGSPGSTPASCTGNTAWDSSWDVSIMSSGSGVIPVPIGKTMVDYFMIGGGGGGQGGWINSAGGGGGHGGNIAVGSKALPSGVTSMSFTVGSGGTGTKGSGVYGSIPFINVIFYPNNGGDGGDTTISVYKDLITTGATANGGKGGAGVNNHKTGYYPVPNPYTYLGNTYCAGMAPGDGTHLGDGGDGNNGQPVTNSRNAGSAGAGGSGISGDNFDWSQPFHAYKGGNGSDGMLRLRFR